MPLFRALLLSVVLAVAASAETIRVGAAISLKDSIGSVAELYTKATGNQVEFSFGSSGQIMAQIKSGAEIDLFISAAIKQVDDLAKEKLVDVSSRKTIVSNTLVLIVPADAKEPPTTFEALGESGVVKIAVGEPKTVPAGQYAGQVLKALKLTDTVAGKLVYGTNVRQVLTYVERGEVTAGIVYATDAKESGDKVRVVAEAAAVTHEPIVYPAVIITASKKQETAKQFLEYLTTAEAKAVFRAKGFGVADAASPPAAK